MKAERVGCEFEWVQNADDDEPTFAKPDLSGAGDLTNP